MRKLLKGEEDLWMRSGSRAVVLRREVAGGRISALIILLITQRWITAGNLGTFWIYQLRSRTEKGQRPRISQPYFAWNWDYIYYSTFGILDITLNHFFWPWTNFLSGTVRPFFHPAELCSWWGGLKNPFGALLWCFGSAERHIRGNENMCLLGGSGCKIWVKYE